MGTTRATVLSGSFVKVTLGATSKILGAGKYEISGETRRLQDVSEFGDDVDVFEFTSADAGTITLTDVFYDPTDPEQQTLQNCARNKTKLIYSNTSGIRFWINSTSYIGVGTSGNILMTKTGAVSNERNGMAKTSFEGQISGSFTYLV